MTRAFAAIAAAVVIAACGEKPVPQPEQPAPSGPAVADAPTVNESSPPAPVPDARPEPEALSDSDLRAKVSAEKRRFIAENAALKDDEMARTTAAPYVVLQQIRQMDVRDTQRVLDPTVGTLVETRIDGTANPAKVAQNAEWVRKAKAFADREAVLLVELHRRFRELISERCKLPALDEKGRVLTCLVTWDRRSFDARLEIAGLGLDPWTRAFYSPTAQRLFSYLGDESLQGLDEFPCAGGRVQKEGDQVLLHVGTHQLVHEYAAIAQGKPLADGDARVFARPAAWFEQGFAEFMSGVEVGAGDVGSLQGAAWSHDRVIVSRIDEARRHRADAERWTLAELMKPEVPSELRRLAQKNAPANPTMESLFVGRAWAFIHFLWHYDKGRYRTRLLDYVDLVMKGTQSTDAFATVIMQRPSRADWGPVEMEYDWYWGRLLARRTGKIATTGQWIQVSTDAPTGRVEDDPEFIEAWTEAHKAKR